MESPIVESFISSIAQSVGPSYLEFINKMNSNECRKEIDSLLIDRCEAQTPSEGLLLKCFLLILHRQISLASQSKAVIEKETRSLRSQKFMSPTRASDS